MTHSLLFLQHGIQLLKLDLELDFEGFYGLFASQNRVIIVTLSLGLLLHLHDSHCFGLIGTMILRIFLEFSFSYPDFLNYLEHFLLN